MPETTHPWLPYRTSVHDLCRLLTPGFALLGVGCRSSPTAGNDSSASLDTPAASSTSSAAVASTGQSLAAPSSDACSSSHHANATGHGLGRADKAGATTEQLVIRATGAEFVGS